MTIRIEHPKERRLYYPHITKCGRPFLICYAAKETAPARQLHSEALELMAAHKLYTVTIHLDWRASDEELLAHFPSGPDAIAAWEFDRATAEYTRITLERVLPHVREVITPRKATAPAKEWPTEPAPALEIPVEPAPQ